MESQHPAKVSIVFRCLGSNPGVSARKLEPVLIS